MYVDDVDVCKVRVAICLHYVCMYYVCIDIYICDMYVLYVCMQVFGSGYIIRPSFISGKSCEIFIGANVDLMGSKSARMLASKTDALVCTSIRTMKRIQNGCADSFVPDQLMVLYVCMYV